MHWLSTLRLRLRSRFRRAQVEQDLEDARPTALRATHGIEPLKGWSRDARRVGWIEDILRDTRYALRALRQKPTFAATAVISLAVGIAAATGLFSIVHAALLDPSPFTDSERLVRIGTLDKGKPRDLAVTGRELVALQQSEVLRAPSSRTAGT